MSFKLCAMKCRSATSSTFFLCVCVRVYFLRQLPCKGCRGGNENASECARIFGESDVSTTQLIHRKVFLILSLRTPQKYGAINKKFFFSDFVSFFLSDELKLRYQFYFFCNCEIDSYPPHHTYFTSDLRQYKSEVVSANASGTQALTHPRVVEPRRYKKTHPSA